jgi:hypothetical protein
MADREFTEADAARVTDAFEAFRMATSRQMRSADLRTIQEAARRKRRWRGYRVAVIAILLVLLPSGIGLSLAEASSHRASPAPSPTAAPSATATASPAPSPSPTTNVGPQNVLACGDVGVALIAGSVDSGTWRALIGVTNLTTEPCTIGGYPTVAALDQAGATVTGQPNPTGASVSSSYPAGATFTLAPGEQAAAEIAGSQTNARGQACPAYQWLRVSPPPGDYITWEISSFTPSFGYAVVCGGFTVSPLYPRDAFQYTPRGIISPTTSASPATAPCRASQLSAHQTYEISTMSSPLTIVAFYNVSTTACYLNGYVSIDAATAGNQTVPISVTHGSNYERSDPGPTHVDLPPGGAASFAIGSGVAFDGGAHATTLTRLTLTPPGSGGQLQVATTIGVSRPNNTGPFPLSETALVASTNGPNQ